MMKVVIDIPERAYIATQKRFSEHNMDDIEFLFIEFWIETVRNGTPLPKGHGDLVDRSQTLRTDCFGDGHDGLRAFHEYEDYAKMRKYLQNIPTIIPAESEDKE